MRLAILTACTLAALLPLKSASAQAPPLPRPGNNSAIPRSAAPTQPPLPPQFNSGFTGDWVGQLEYRDYSATSPNTPHVALPTWLTMSAAPDGRAVNFLYTFDDGLGKDGKPKIVTERTILAFTDDTALITGTGNAQNQSFKMEGAQEFAKLGRGTLVLTGPGKENDHPVEMRITLKLGRNRFTWRKETRPQGSTDNFVFRDEYSLTRATAPAVPQ